MLKTSLKITALSVATLTLLSACGAASKLEDAADRAQDELDNAADRAENERERLARLTPPSSPTAAVADGVASVRSIGPYSNAGTYEVDANGDQTRASDLDNSFNITQTETQGTFALVRSGDNLVMTVNGTAYTFTPRETSPAIPERNGNPGIPARYRWNTVGAGFLSGTETRDLRNVLDGTDSDVQGTYVNYTTFPNNLSDTTIRDFNLNYTDGYATVGIQTLPSVVASQTATAIYRGEVTLDVQSNFTKTAGQNASSQADPSLTEYLIGFVKELTMTVDFTGNTIEGDAIYEVYSYTTNQAIPDREATITFNSAPIVGNGFAGTFTMDDDYRNARGITNNPTGNYAGNFFGPAADDIAGVMRFEAQSGVIGIGGFRADRR